MNRVDVMDLIVVDLEATCWDTPRPRNHMEIIEIGAVRLDAELTVVDEFDCFVRPVVGPKLSQFCTALTTIKQADVDEADMFPAVFARFIEWIGDGPYRLCSWASLTSVSFGWTALGSAWCFPSSSRVTT